MFCFKLSYLIGFYYLKFTLNNNNNTLNSNNLYSTEKSKKTSSLLLTRDIENNKVNNNINNNNEKIKIIKILEKDFFENMQIYLKDYNTISINALRMISPFKPVLNTITKLNEQKTLSRDNSNIKKPKKKEENFLISSTVNTIYNKFIMSKLTAKTNNNTNDNNNFNKTAIEINPKLENKFIKKISNYTNQLVSNDIQQRGKTANRSILNKSNNIDLSRNKILSRGACK